LPDLALWLPLVRKMRPAQPWPDVAGAVNVALPTGYRRFTTDRLVSAVKLLVGEALAEPALLGTAPHSRPRKGLALRKRATEVAAALVVGRAAWDGAAAQRRSRPPRPAGTVRGATRPVARRRAACRNPDADGTLSTTRVAAKPGAPALSP
jgi:hypothetical protein